MSKQIHVEIAIGVFVVAALVITAGMILAFGGGAGVFSETYEVEIDFNHIGDLLPGAPVKYGGVRIGFVKSIALQSNGKVRATASIYDTETVRLYEGYTALIQTSGLVGDTFVEFTAADSPKTVPLKESEQVIDGTGQPSTTELLAQVKQIGEKVDTIAGHVEDIIGDEQFKEDVRATVHSTAGAAKAAERFLVDLERTSKNIYAASDDIRATTGVIRTVGNELRDAMNQTITNEENIEAVRETLANIRAASRDAKTTTTHLASILARTDALIEEEEPNIRGSIANIAKVTDDIRDKLSKIRTDTGVLKYFTTDALNQKIEAVMGHVQEVSTQMRDMFANTTKLELLKAYVGGKRLWAREERELIRMGFTETEEMEDAHYRREEKKHLRRERLGIDLDEDIDAGDADGAAE